MALIPQITKEETQKFAAAWRNNGLFVSISDLYIQFATDYANVVLRSFVEQCQAQVAAAIKAQQTAQGVPTENVDGPKLIVES